MSFSVVMPSNVPNRLTLKAIQTYGAVWSHAKPYEAVWSEMGDIRNKRRVVWISIAYIIINQGSGIKGV